MKSLRFFLAFALTVVASVSAKSVHVQQATFVPKQVIDTPASSSSSSSTRTIKAASKAASKSDHAASLSSASAASAASIRAGAQSSLSIDPAEIKGGIIFLIFDHLFRKAFTAYKINFPSQLGGCCILFTAMIIAEGIIPGVGNAVFEYLTPGANLLAKWLPVFFVPGLAMLPLAPSMGSPLEILKVLVIVVVGFYFSCASTAYAVLGLRKLEGSATATVSEVPEQSATAAPKPLPFSPELVSFLTKGVVLSGAASVASSKLNLDNGYATPLRTLFMTFATFFGYVWGARLPPSFTKIVHPLVTSTAVTHFFTALAALLTGATFNTFLATYKTGSMAFSAAGCGDILMYLLGPSVVSFAISMYSRKNVIADNFLIVCTGMVVASAGGLFGTAAFVRLLQVGGAAGDVLRKSILPRNVTTPLAIAITNILKGDIPQACAVVVLTGIYGATFGASFLTSLGITDPVARGLGVGGSGQGLGVASMMGEKEAFPFAAIGMVLTAIGATTLVSIPPVAKALVNLATGK